MDRRTFLKWLTGLGASIGSLKFFKPSTKIAQEVAKQAPNVPQLPEWFIPLTDKILKKGKDVTSKHAIEDGMIVKEIEIDGDKVYGNFYRDGKIEVNVESADGAFEQPYSLIYDPPRDDYIPGEGFIKEPGRFEIGESSPRTVLSGDPENPDFDWDLDYESYNYGDQLSDTTKLEMDVTGKPERIVRNKTGQQPGSNNPDPVETLVNKYGEYDPPEPDYD